jgi:hypothetical protein
MRNTPGYVRAHRHFNFVREVWGGKPWNIDPRDFESGSQKKAQNYIIR